MIGAVLFCLSKAQNRKTWQVCGPMSKNMLMEIFYRKNVKFLQEFRGFYRMAKVSRVRLAVD